MHNGRGVQAHHGPGCHRTEPTAGVADAPDGGGDDGGDDTGPDMTHV